MLTQQQIEDFRKMLEQRFLEVRDLENSSLADLLVDVSLAEIDRLVGQIRDIDASLLRIAHGS